MAEGTISIAGRLIRRLRVLNGTISTAESCTGGLLSSTLTDLSGASQWFSHGWIAYSNEAKMGTLGVDPALLEAHGAVSAQVAEAMAVGALRRSGAMLALSITGIAGPLGEGTSKPVGMVYVGIASEEGIWVRRHESYGTRAENRIAFIEFTMRTAIDFLDKGPMFSDAEE